MRERIKKEEITAIKKEEITSAQILEYREDCPFDGMPRIHVKCGVDMQVVSHRDQEHNNACHVDIALPSNSEPLFTERFK